MSGPSGRLDAEFIWDFETCVTVEVKTQKATGVNNATADMLQKLGHCWSEWYPAMHVDQAVHLAPVYQILVQIQREKKWKTETSTTGSSQLEEVMGDTWQSKVLGTIYQVWSTLLEVFHDGSTVVQVWHQLSTRECNHGIISNQHMFLLVHRSGNNLHIFPSYQYQPDDNNALAATLSDLSFFIVHSLVARPGNSGTTQSPGLFVTSLSMPLDNPDNHSHNLPQPGTPATPGVSGGSIMMVGIPTSCRCVYLRFLTPEQPGITCFELGDLMVEHMLTTPDV